MNCYLNINLSKLYPEWKFKFSGENVNQSGYENNGDYITSPVT